MHVITLRAYLSELATIRAFDESEDFVDDLNKIASRVDELLMTELSCAKEFVEVTDNFIRVGINCNLIDDSAISQALEMVGQLDSFKPGTMVQIGQPVQVYENKIQWNKRRH